jgi:sec-independent protein translocase protein TatC
MSSEEQKPRDARERGAAPEPEESEANASDEDSGSPASGNGTGEDLAPQSNENEVAQANEAPQGESGGKPSVSTDSPAADQKPAPEPKPAADTQSRKPPTYYDDYDYQDDDPYADAPKKESSVVEAKPESKMPPPPPPPPTGGDGSDGGDDDDEGMARMSFLDHLDELRTRILHSIYGLGAVYLVCLIFAQNLWTVVAEPFMGAVANYDPPIRLSQIAVSESFYLVYLKVPLVFGIFVAAPWLMYQAWAFIAPGLYKRERRWALPFVLSTAALFVLGGVFGYFIALRYAITFLVGVGIDIGLQQNISADSYFNMGIAIILGLGVVFQMPVVIFFLTLIRLVTPTFLLSNVRYAILLIFVLAAAVTPTPDVFNMILFAGPMILLFYVGIFASYVLVLSREGRKMPATVIITILLVFLLIAAGAFYYLHFVLGYQLINQFPWIAPPQ